MADLQIDASSLLTMMRQITPRLTRIAHLGTRKGCITAGLLFRGAVRASAPVLKPKNVWGLWDGGSHGRNRWPHVQGELRKSIYFTYSPKNSNIPEGKITYLVGLPHGGGQGHHPGWYAHMVNSDHKVVNFYVRKGGQPYPLRKDTPPPRGIPSSWRPHNVQGKGFVKKGHDAVAATANARAIQAANDEIARLLRNL